MEFIRNDDWVRKVAASESELECDISAGLNIDSHFSEYTSFMQSSKNYISGEKLMAVLQEELGNLLTNEDLEAIACATQSYARNRLVERTRLTENAS